MSYAYFKTVYDNNGAGALLWNLSPESDDQCYLFSQEDGAVQSAGKAFGDIATEIREFSTGMVAISDNLAPALQCESVGNLPTPDARLLNTLKNNLATRYFRSLKFGGLIQPSVVMSRRRM